MKRGVILYDLSICICSLNTVIPFGHHGLSSKRTSNVIFLLGGLCYDYTVIVFSFLTVSNYNDKHVCFLLFSISHGIGHDLSAQLTN